jgi:hypothetical protein
MMTYQHAEAFCLMKYRSDDGTEEELIWNSRDGVTPFVITLRSGKRATHVDWQDDQCQPDRKPQPGDRIFIDMTEEELRTLVTQRVDEWLGSSERDEVLQAFGSREQAIDHLMGDYRPGTPNLIEFQP